MRIAAWAAFLHLLQILAWALLYEHLCPDIPVESTMIGRELGLMRNVEFRFIKPAMWNSALQCWDLELPAAA